MDSATKVVTQDVASSAGSVWDILADGWLYSSWVVGASRIREVDRDWPAPGSRIHHSVGIWPLLINDHSRVLKMEPGAQLKLRARAWPAGEATVEITVEAVGPTSSRISIREDAVAGPIRRLVPRPLRQWAVRPRNDEALRRLALMAAGRSANR